MYRKILFLLLLFVVVSSCSEEQPQTCVIDSDCLLKGYVCRSNACLKQASCESDTDCQYKGEICKDKLCVVDDGSGNNPKPKEKLCSPTCLGNSECEACTGGKNFCINGACVVKERAKKYGRCGSEVGKACEPNLVCSGVSTFKFCLAECDPKAETCDGGKGTCFNPNGLQVGLCVPNGEGALGATCSSNFQGEKTLDTKKFCKKEFHCVDSKCVKPVEVKNYEVCGPGKICKDKSTCTFLSPSMKHGFCLPSCDPSQTACDGGKGICQKLGSNKSGCLPKGTTKVGHMCGLGLDALKSENFCEEGLKCTVFAEGKKGLCVKMAAECKEGACDDGYSCLFDGTTGYCVPTCDDKGACKNSLSCQNPPPGVQSGKVCLP